MSDKVYNLNYDMNTICLSALSIGSCNYIREEKERIDNFLYFHFLQTNVYIYIYTYKAREKKKKKRITERKKKQDLLINVRRDNMNIISYIIGF